MTDGKLLEGSLTSGYKTLNLHIDDNNGTIYFHREVAKLFNKKNSPKKNLLFISIITKQIIMLKT